MSNEHSLTAENILSTLPDVLRRNNKLHALAASIAKTLASDVAMVDRVRIYNTIDTLPEEVLDALAYDFKIDWWDPGYSVQQKRQILRDNWFIHRHLGTKASLEMAISAIYPRTKVLEWFEYNGDPYYFKLLIDISYASITPEQHQQVMERVNYYKNLRSHLDEVEYAMIPEGDSHGYAGVALTGIGIKMNAGVD